MNAEGVLSLSIPSPEYTEEIDDIQGNVTISSVIFRNQDTPVYSLMASPENPQAAIVYAPGAGVTIENHRSRAIRYAGEGIAFLVMDIRGNGGKTSGYPLNFQRDFELFSSRSWPQYYLITADLVIARRMITDRYDIPVYAVGSSNGGRYAALAAAIDPGFAGYIGISTSGFGKAGNKYQGDWRQFLLSVDPDTYIQKISPRPVCVFHAQNDPIIPFEGGHALFEAASEPKEFIAFNGSHGINSEVDERLIAAVLTFNAR